MRLRVRAESPGLRKALLVSLATLLVMSLTATLSVSAQANSDESPGDTIEGRVIVRVQDRTGADGIDDYRVEFGFLPQWAMDEKDPWSEAVATFSDLLPRARYLTKATIEARRDTDNRRWLRSSPVSVPRQGAAGADTALSGRVIARYNPDGQGRLRIELGFLPEQAFASTADTEEAVAQYGEQFLPSSRYLTASLIADRRGVWLRSSVVAMHGPVQPPVIESISCSPSPPTVDESVTCTATLSGGAPDSYSWSGGVKPSDDATYATSFSASDSHTVSLMVGNARGGDSDSITVEVQPAGPRPLRVDSISCTPSPAETNRYVACTASLSGGTPDSYFWKTTPSFGTSINDGASFTVRFYDRAEYTVSLTVNNSEGCHTGSVPLTVTGNEAPSCGNSNASVEEGKRATLIYACSDPDGDPLTITATSSDDSVATVALSSSTYTAGMTVTVTGVSPGQATIALRASDGHWEILNSADVEVVPTGP